MKEKELPPDSKSCPSATIDTLLTILYEKSDETEKHSKRLGEYCHVIGQRLGFSSGEMDEISLLALLHDIGKVGIHVNILQKPGALTPQEWDVMKEHPAIGCQIVRSIPELGTVSDLILAHHERWDGKGYPRGLKGEEIPLFCRILAVADSFDAMINDRAYRKAMEKEAAIQEIERNAGTQFDPGVAELFVKIMTNMGRKPLSGQ
ncbi:MAG: HD-GYP domain-containing protein [Lacrimispora sp.]|uniref:HD-GYP domain-containing protein n=1 Tax=Lacrimispora sp. TaxID=2719234 RepID=UPI0039E4E74E